MVPAEKKYFVGKISKTCGNVTVCIHRLPNKAFVVHVDLTARMNNKKM